MYLYEVMNSTAKCFTILGDGGPSQDEDDSGQAVHPASTPAAQLSPPTPAVMMMGVPAAAPLQPPPLPSNAPPIPMVQTNVIAGVTNN